MRRFTLPLSMLVAVFIFTMLIFVVRVPAAQAQDYIPLAPITGEGIASADQFTSCQPRPTYNAAGEMTNEGELCLPKYLRTLYNMGIALAGLFLVFSIVRGGFTLMFTDSVLNRMEGKKIILQAMGGAVIVFSSYIFMNMINPQLGERLNLSLKFPSITIRKFTSKLEAVPGKWTDAQIVELRERTEKRDVALKAKVKEYEDRADGLMALAEVLPEGDDQIYALEEEANYYYKAAAELDLGRVSGGKERLASIATANASSKENLDKAIGEAGVAVGEIKSAFDKASKAFNSDPKTVASLKVEEMQRISTIEKMTAYGIIENPPMKDEVKGSGATTRIEKKLDTAALNNKIEIQMNKIINEETKQIQKLNGLQTSDSTAPEVNVWVATKIADVERIAKIEICAIKNECANKKYSCKDLYANILCTR